jgi:hypothetical protein
MPDKRRKPVIDQERAARAARIREAADKLGPRTRAAAAARVSVQQLHNLLTGKSIATERSVAGLAEAAHFDAHWIETGEGVRDLRQDLDKLGVMLRGEDAGRSEVRKVELRHGLIGRLRLVYRSAGLPLTAADEGRVISDAIEHLSESGLPVEAWGNAVELIVKSHRLALGFAMHRFSPPQPADGG